MSFGLSKIDLKYYAHLYLEYYKIYEWDNGDDSRGQA